MGCIESTTRVGRKKKLEKEYILGGEIGKGRYGSVRLCRSKVNPKDFACKTLINKAEETVHLEVEMMQHLSNHPGIVMLHAVFEYLQCFHLIMELCAGGRLMDYMANEGSFSEQRAAVLMKQLISVIKYCHEMGVIHRDIKPENILLTSPGRMKLADFGLAVQITTGWPILLFKRVRSYLVLLVAQLMWHQRFSWEITLRKWIFGLLTAGVLLHLLLVGGLPFKGESLDAVFEKIKKAELDFSAGMWASISDLFKDLVFRMLTRDVSKRITFDEILNHPWILFYTTSATEVVGRKPRVDYSKPTIEVERIVTLSSTALFLQKVLAFRSEEPDASSGIVDAHTSAISLVRPI